MSKNTIDTNLHEHFSFKIDNGQDPLRIDKFLMSRIENVTRNKIQQSIKDGNIFVNDVKVKSNYKIKPKDLVRVLMDYPPYENTLLPEEIPLEIIYEDESVIVLNKKAGMVVHPGHGNYSGTLANALIYHFKNLPKNSNNRPGLVHRIDKDTSGLLVVAKNQKSMTNLSKQFFLKKSKRIYHTLVWGDVKSNSGTIEGNLVRNPKNRLQMIVDNDANNGKHAITNYEIMEKFRYVTYLKCKLDTGRTHQLRVHLKYIGHTIFNDERYSGNIILKGTTFSKYRQFVDNCFKICNRQALHAKILGFFHPETNKWLEFDSEIPDDMSKVIDKWRKYSRN
tara:strand:+ start:2266 stop:3273 length:1008 start_codon:yes stop_codon:yes gene_type:complete